MGITWKKIFGVTNIYCNSVKCKCIVICGRQIPFKKQPPFFERVKDILTRYIFSLFKIRKNSVLLIEPNPYHGEILPGFVKYFQDLGYNVDLFLRYQNVKDSSLLAFDNINIFPCSALCMKEILKNKKIKNYEFCFLTSSALWDSKLYFGSFLDYLGFVPKTKNGILMVEHNIDPCFEEYDEEKYLKENRLFTLSGFHDTPILNPHFFINLKSRPKNKVTTFIVSGHSIKSEKILHEVSLKLLVNNTNNFKIYILGKKFEISNELKEHVFSLGYVSFKTMYEKLEESDFILPLLDYTNKDHKKYLEGTTFGARQQCLGFLKPVLINEHFAKVYDFDDKNAILYNENNLFEAMTAAINMKQDNYLKMQNNLKNLQQIVYNKSLENLRKSTLR